MIKRILIYDPVPFKGGSKKVMKTILAELPKDIEAWVLSNDEESWCESTINFVPLFSPHYLEDKTTGLLYFLKQFIYLLSLLWTMIKLKRFTKIIAISGPNVDFALYLLSELIHINVIQLIQGNIAKSKVATFGLLRANKVFYLPSTYQSIIQALKPHKNNSNIDKTIFTPFVNGINKAKIKPKKAHSQVGLLWAASLLKWKRVELFIDAISTLNAMDDNAKNYFANICYIEPKTDAYFNIAQVRHIDNVFWYKDPENLNDIRATSSIFISTSEKEPFGLSILEAMAAGLAIVIPADDAYWDQHLTDGYNCIKYNPNDINSLVEALLRLINNAALLSKIARQAKNSAQHYCHVRCYAQILKCIPH
ncbi:glycosyltransferase family 4 protein [Colwelliaceae bacterium MEBiC 14330]